MNSPLFIWPLGKSSQRDSDVQVGSIPSRDPGNSLILTVLPEARIVLSGHDIIN